MILSDKDKRYIRHLYFEMEIHPYHREKYRQMTTNRAAILIDMLERERGIDKLSDERKSEVRSLMRCKGYKRERGKKLDSIRHE